MELPVSLRAAPDAWIESIRPELLRGINRLRPSFTVLELANAVQRLRLQDIKAFLDQMVGTGALQRDGAIYSAPTDVKLQGESLAARKQQNMWNILRGSQGRPSIDVATLAIVSSTSQVVISKAEAGRYVAALVDGKMLRERSPARFWLPPDRNGGPLAPLLMQVSFVVDRNRWSINRNLVAHEARL